MKLQMKSSVLDRAFIYGGSLNNFQPVTLFQSMVVLCMLLDLQEMGEGSKIVSLRKSINVTHSAELSYHIHA